MITHHTRIAVAGALLIAAATAFTLACGVGGRSDKLVIVVQPTTTAAELTSDAKEIEQFLEDRLDVDVELRFPQTYAGVVESLRFGHADAAFMSAWPASLAAREANAEVVLAEVREVTIGDELTEAPFYFSYWVVPEDSPYTTLEELEGATVAFSSPLSTSGYVGPVARLVELGLISPGTANDEADPGEFFGDVFFAGGYAQGWEALRSGQVDVAIIAGDVPEELYNEVLDNTRVIEQQGPLPSHAVVFSDDLNEPLRTQLRDALLELGQDEHRDLMRKFISGIFVRFQETTTDEHLGALEGFLRSTGLQFAEAGQNAEPGPDPEPDADPEPTTGVASPPRAASPASTGALH